MKLFRLALPFFFSFFLCCSPFLAKQGFASSFFLPISPYVGADYRVSYQGNSVPYSNDAGNVSIDRGSLFHALNLHAGLRLGSFLGAEAGFYYALPSSGQTTIVDHGAQDVISAKLGFFSPFVDIMGYVPLDSDENFDFLASIGAVIETAHLEIKDAGEKHTYKNTSFGARFGLGFQYNMTDHLNFRTMVRYQLASHNMDSSAVPGNLVKNGFWSANFGANFQF